MRKLPPMKPLWTITQVLRGLPNRRRDSVPRADEIDSLLVVELTRLGDVLSMLPAVRLLVSAYPFAIIHLFVDELYAPLLRGLELDIQVHGIPASATAAGLLRAIRTARKLNVRLACSMSPAKRNVILTMSSGSRFKVGYLHAVHSLVHYLSQARVESRGFALQADISCGADNIEERGLKVCLGLGLRPDGPLPPLELRAGLCDEVMDRPGMQGALPNGDYVVIHPFSGWRYRSWSLANYFDLARLLTSRMEVEVVFLFVPRERTEWEKSLKYWGGEPQPRVFSSGDLLESAVLMKGAALFVGNDSGPLHLAACLGIPRIGLFGPSSPSLTAPRAGNGTYMYKEVDCSPCAQTQCIRPETPCIDLIDVDEVFEAALQAVQNRRPTRSAAHG